MGKQTCTIRGRTIAISHGIHLYPQSFEFTSHPTTHQPAISQRLNLYTIASLSRIDQCRGKNKRIDDIFWIVRFLSRLDLRKFAKLEKERERSLLGLMYEDEPSWDMIAVLNTAFYLRVSSEHFAVNDCNRYFSTRPRLTFNQSLAMKG